MSVPRSRGNRRNLAPDLTPEEVAARLGVAAPARDPAREPTREPAAAIATEPVDAGGSRPVIRPATRRAPDRRRVLWWDSATIVGGVALSLLALQLLGSPRFGPVALESPSADPTGVVTGPSNPLATPATLAPPATLGVVVDPSLGLDATPTPIPVITLGPTPRPTPTAKPGTPPVANFTWVQTGKRRIAFTSTGSGDITTYHWTFGDGETATTPNPTHAYPSHGSYTVRLTVTGPGGTDSRTRTVSVVSPTPPPATPAPPTPTLPPEITPAPPTPTPEPTPPPPPESP